MPSVANLDGVAVFKDSSPCLIHSDNRHGFCHLHLKRKSHCSCLRLDLFFLGCGLPNFAPIRASLWITCINMIINYSHLFYLTSLATNQHTRQLIVIGMEKGKECKKLLEQTDTKIGWR